MTAESDRDASARRASEPPQGSSAVVERRNGFRAIGIAVSQVAAPLVKRRGGGPLVRLKADWAAIVGEAWARVSWPMALGRDGALKLRVLSGAALELQHRAPLVTARINLYFGRPTASRLVLVQGPLPLVPPPAAAPSLPRVAAPAAFDGHLAQIPDPDLRAALARLGRAVAAAEAETSPSAIAPEPGTD